MYRTVHSAATEQPRVGGIHNRIDRERRDIRADDAQRYFSHGEGFRSFTRENHRLSGMSIASTMAQHR